MKNRPVTKRCFTGIRALGSLLGTARTLDFVLGFNAFCSQVKQALVHAATPREHASLTGGRTVLHSFCHTFLSHVQDDALKQPKE